WWEKYTESFCARFMSATGTYKPSIWQVEFPKWILAMSLRPGSSTQFEFVFAVRAPSVAPHMGQLSWLLSITARHHPQVALPPDGRGRGAGAAGAGGAVTTCGAACEYCGGAAGGGGACAGLPHVTQKRALSWIWEPQLVQNMTAIRLRCDDAGTWIESPR